MATSSISNSSALSGSGTLSSAGLGSGLDVTGIVSKLMAIERRPIDLIDTKSTVVQAQLTAYGSLKGSLSSLQTAVTSLTSKSTYSATKATVADTEQLGVTSDSTAAAGSYSVQVVNLAKAEKLKSAAFSSASDSVGTGTITFDFGTYSTTGGVTGFALNTSKKQVSVTIPSGSDSLASIADAINAAKAGISATVLNDGTSSYLSFSPTDPGAANALRIQVDDNDGNDADSSGLSRLAFDKSTGHTAGSVDLTSAVNIAAASDNNKFMIAVDGGTATEVTLADGTYDNTNIVAAMQAAVDSAVGAGKAVVSLNAGNQLVVASAATGGLSSIAISGVTGNIGLNTLFGASGTSVSAIKNLTETVAPQDAKIIVDGVTVIKSTNTITDAIRGVTLSLTKESAEATTVKVAADNSALSSALEAFVKAYNSTSGTLSELLAYDVKTGKAGALQGEGTVRSIQAQLRQALQSITKGGGLTGLSEIGVSFQRDGTLQFSSDKLNTALSDPTKNVKSLLIGTDGTSGIANKIDNLLSTFLDSDGTLTARTDGLNSQVTLYEKRKAELEVRMSSIEARLRKQYNALDSLIASMNQTSSYLTQQLANLPNNNSDK
ncbi:MAG: flagellar filament capping protein FliD [Sterolibacteriaceae bacterium MAG5]|nr:flagellar filament capping protein FliD [Candidatus Nitricoxidireducens bremensis]